MINEVTENLRKLKKPLKSKKHNSTLLSIISDDLLKSGELPFCLLICIIITAILVVSTTHYTRLLIAHREQLINEYNGLNVEWRNLIFKENIFSDHNLIEQIATEKLHLQYINPSQENIVIQK